MSDQQNPAYGTWREALFALCVLPVIIIANSVPRVLHLNPFIFQVFVHPEDLYSDDPPTRRID